MTVKTSTYAGVGTAYLSEQTDESDEDGKFLIHGVALGASDITIGQSGTKKLWPAAELEKAASTLAGTDLVRDHINNSKGKIGEVLHAQYVDGVGVVYEAEIASHYDEIANDIRAGLMEVSVRAYHAKEDKLEEDNDTGALIVEDIHFDNLSVVTNGASPSNTANTGPISNIIDDPSTVEASASFGDDQQVATLTRAEPFDRETSDGVFNSESSDSEEASVTVDDTPTEGEPVADDENDVDVEDDEDDEAEAAETYTPEEGDMVEWQANPDMYGEVVHNPDGRDIVMVEVYTTEDGDQVSTGHTLTAGYADVVSRDNSTDSDSEDAAVESDNDAESESEKLPEADDETADVEDASVESDNDESDTSSLMYDTDNAEQMEFDPDEPDVFESKEDAMSRAMELGLEETHTHEYEGTTYHMPGDSHEAYTEAVSESGAHDDEEDDAEMSASSETTWATVATSTASSDMIQTSNSELSTTMINFETADAEELSDELDDPVVVERSELEDLSESAEQSDAVQDEIDELSAKLDEQSDASEIVGSLSEEDIDLIEADDDTVVVENAKAEMFDEVTQIYAEELADYSPFTAEDLAERFSPVDLKERVDSHEEAELSSTIGDVEPEPESGNAEEEELGEEAEEAAEEEELREKYAEELERAGWDSQAQKVRDGDLPVTQG